MMLRALLFVLMLTLPTLTQAAPSEPMLPKPLLQYRQSGAQIYYLGKFEELNGWVLMRAGQPEFYYSTQSGNALVLGLLFDGKGNLLTPSQMAALSEDKKTLLNDMVASNPRAIENQENVTGQIPEPGMPVVAEAPAAPDVAEAAPAAPVVAAPEETVQTLPTLEEAAKSVEPAKGPAEALFDQILHAPGLVWGKADAPAFYAFLDPNCVHCQRFLTDVEPSVLAGRVSVHILPVAFNDKSKKQAAYLMAVGDGAERLVRYAKGDTDAIPVSNVSVQAVNKNVDLLAKWNIRATPIIIYRADTGDIRLVRGRPLDLPTVIEDLVP